jgi:subtilisin family serine protease
MHRPALIAAALALVAAAPAAGADPPVSPSSAPRATGTPALGQPQDPRLDKRAPKLPKPDHWIVELDSPPLAAYEGGGDPDKATSPRATGRRLNVRSQGAQAWRAELDRREDAVIARAGVSIRPDVRYRTAFNGFAARLTDDEVAALRRTPGVRRVVSDQVMRVSQEPGDQPGTAGIGGSEAEFLGLPDGLWQRLGGPRQAGRGVIVGVVDSGITPEAESFAPRDLEVPAVWNGACESGEEFPVTSCNGKLIGARYFANGFDPSRLPEGTYLSPRDEVGHGTHVAATAVGNEEVDPVIAGNDLGVDRITGVAPAAHLAAYKACWLDGTCFFVDIVAAIDRAVADGVDVLNLSLGGFLRPDQKLDPVQLALLNADAAGVFVANAAGNAGEFPGAIGTPTAAPWLTAVAATTSPRTFRTTITAESGGSTVEVPAASTGPGVDGGFVDAAAFDEGGTDPFENPRFCVSGMTPERVRGKVVLCDAWAPLGLVSQVLEDAGAVGVLFRVGDDSDDFAVNTLLPGAFVEATEADRLRELAAEGPTTVSVAPASAAEWQADRVAWFSSRGPNPAAADVLRPDVAAPGVNVLSAWAPRTFFWFIGEDPEEKFAAISGTSMASPHVAGVGALLTQLHPTWSGAEIRSALVTTAKPAVDSDGDGSAPHMAAGAGRIDPQAAADPELVVAPTTEEYQRYAEGLDPEQVPGDLTPIAPRDLNLPHLALEGAIAPASVTRTVQSVGGARANWVTRVEGNDFNNGFGVEVSPRRFTLAPGQRQALTIDVVDSAGLATFRDAAVVLHNQQTGRDVRLPLAVRNPGVLSPPAHIAVDDAPAEGSKDVAVTVSGSVSAVAHGLARPETHELETNDASGIQEALLPVDVPEGATLLSAQIPEIPGVEFPGVSLVRDVDGDGRYTPLDPIVGEPGPGDDFSRADLVAPEPGKYLVRVSGFSEQPFRAATSVWLVNDPRPDDPEPAPGLVAAGDPFNVYPGAERTLSLRWNGVDGDAPLRGVVVWHEGQQPGPVLGRSIVEVRPAATTR